MVRFGLVETLTTQAGESMGEVYGELTGANKQARAAQRAADAQIAASREERDLALRLAEASPQEIRAYESNLTANEKRLANAERMFASIDPAILEASDQILKILKGEQTSAGGLYEGERNRMRENLIDQLRTQYGPGAEFTALGRKALQDFDAQTNMGSIGVQQNALGTLGNVFGMGSAANQEIGSSATGVAGAGGLFGSLNERKLRAASGTSQNIINTAGGEFIGDMMRGQSQGQFANLLIKGGAAYLGAGAPGFSSLFGSPTNAIPGASGGAGVSGAASMVPNI